MERARKLLIVTSRFPFSTQETYLKTELGELINYFQSVAVMPVRTPAPGSIQSVPPGVEVLAWPLLGFGLLRRAAQAFYARPKETLAAIAQIVWSRDPGRTKNLAVVLKALALAQWTMEHGFDHIHAYWISTPATVAMIAASVSGVTWSSTAHRWDIYERNAFDVKERSASFVRTISARGTADIGKRMPSLSDRIFELRLGTSVPAVRQASLSYRDEFRIVCPAALVPVKGHADLFAAILKLRSSGVPVRCTLAGSGPLRVELEAEVTALRLSDAVEFAGFVPQQTLHEWYRNGRFAAVVLASRSMGETMEGVPSALVEAMAFGVPAVATDSGSVGELIDEQCGRLVKAGRPDELADALMEVYLYPATARMRACRAYERVKQQHDVRTQMRTLAAMFSAK